MLHDPPVPHEQVPGTTMLRCDVYPADVNFSFAPRPLGRTRAIVTADRVQILVAMGTQIGVLYEAKLEDYAGSRREVVATTEDGTITLTRAGGCGCGSKLKTYRPFQRVAAMAKVPA
jgi:hypothetical protein